MPHVLFSTDIRQRMNNTYENEEYSQPGASYGSGDTMLTVVMVSLLSCLALIILTAFSYYAQKHNKYEASRIWSGEVVAKDYHKPSGGLVCGEVCMDTSTPERYTVTIQKEDKLNTIEVPGRTWDAISLGDIATFSTDGVMTRLSQSSNK
jgi:hypothetical protein